jgi:hypothetical protein
MSKFKNTETQSSGEQTKYGILPDKNVKGTAPRDFQLQVFYMISFPQAPDYTIRAISILKIRRDIRSSRCTTGVVDTGGKWKKSSIKKVFNISFGQLWVVELAYR